MKTLILLLFITTMSVMCIGWIFLEKLTKKNNKKYFWKKYQKYN